MAANSGGGVGSIVIGAAVIAFFWLTNMILFSKLEEHRRKDCPPPDAFGADWFDEAMRSSNYTAEGRRWQKWFIASWTVFVLAGLSLCFVW